MKYDRGWGKESVACRALTIAGEKGREREREGSKIEGGKKESVACRALTLVPISAQVLLVSLTNF